MEDLEQVYESDTAKGKLMRHVNKRLIAAGKQADLSTLSICTDDMLINLEKGDTATNVEIFGETFTSDEVNQVLA